MLECFGESEEKNDRPGLAAKAADVEAADSQPVVGFGIVASSWQGIITTSAAEAHGEGP
jgi:hypothetical protein